MSHLTAAAKSEEIDSRDSHGGDNSYAHVRMHTLCLLVTKNGQYYVTHIRKCCFSVCVFCCSFPSRLIFAVNVKPHFSHHSVQENYNKANITKWDLEPKLAIRARGCAQDAGVDTNMYVTCHVNDQHMKCSLWPRL